MSLLARLAILIRQPLMPALHALLVVGLACGNAAYLAILASPGVAVAAESDDAPVSEAELEELVGPIALYPDELLGIVLPASTYPLQIVQAARLLDRLDKEPDLKPDEDWDESVIGLMNYPEVIKLMNDDLDWTWKLGDAVAKDQSQVMDAVQGFRGRADEAGNLESNDKMTITREDAPDDLEVPEGEAAPQIIVIESASPEVIYVPTYTPSTVVVHHTTPYPWYWSRPYPYYYRPAAAFWTGMFVGAAVGWGLSWGWGRHYHGRRHGHHNSSVKVNNNINVNVNRPTRPSTPNRPGGGPGNKPGGGGNWKPDKGPGKPGGGRPGGGTRPTTRPADGKGPGAGGQRPSAGQRPAGGKQPGAGGQRPSTGQRPAGGKQPSAGQRPSTGAGKTRPAAGGQRPSTGQAKRPSSGTSNRSGRDLTTQRSNRSSSMGSYGSGSKSRSNASRGSSSRNVSRGGGGSRGGSRGGGSRGGGGRGGGGRGGGGRR